MVRQYLEELANKGYTMNFHYTPETKEIYIALTRTNDRVKFVSSTLPSTYLSDDEGLVMELRKLVKQLEETKYA